MLRPFGIDSYNSSKEQGFTLVELAIVLVIIGLIIGGVLVGQDMIRSAEIRSQVSQIERFNQGTNTFRGKYSCLPGDCPTATTWFSGSTNGDGNGMITDVNGTFAGDATDFSNAQGEIVNVFTHLSLAGLTDGYYVNTTATGMTTPIPSVFPRGKISQNGIMPLSIAGRNYWHLGVTSALTFGTDTSLAAGFSNNTLSPYAAWQVDSKMDDGSPVGGVLAKIGTANTAMYTAAAGSATSCYNTGITAYNYTVATEAVANIALCQLQFRWN